MKKKEMEDKEREESNFKKFIHNSTMYNVNILEWNSESSCISISLEVTLLH